MTDVLSPRLIATLRNVTARFRPDTCEVRRTVDVEDGSGGSTREESTIATVPCRLDASSLQPSEEAIAGRLGWSAGLVADLPFDTDVTPSDRLRVNGDRVLQIGGVMRGGNASVSTRVVAREVG